MTAAPTDATLEILERLIAFPTVSADSNLALIGHAEALLQGAGFSTRRLPDPTGRKAGLMARIGPEGAGGIMLSAHSDVVPVEGQGWTRPPFRLTREGGRLYGRGTTDMKGFLASSLSLAQRVGRPSRPLMLAISYDEELGCLGIRDMLPGIEALGWKPDLCIVGEPTSMRTATGHKGKAAYEAVCHGTAGHSALAPRHVNALHLAAEFIGALRRIQDGYAGDGAQDPGHDIPFSTVHAGRMEGGRALNIVPDHARIEFELRHLPGDAPGEFLARLDREISAILPAFRRLDASAGITVTQVNRYPGFGIAPEDPLVARMTALCGNPETIKVGYGTEAGHLSGLGIPTLVCGPGDMERDGHKPDESLAVAELAACDAMMERIRNELAGPPRTIPERP